ncbi:TetR/AcrR family transcriptional regulator [Sagittula salina]|uniref:TetR/AcrR family transcriptional regulator n=1 Tax=Sagittula salina TaxID=2820268 RepID=UPI0031591176
MRTRLIRAGLERLTERGYPATSVDDLLKAAGVPKGSFYHHFGSKAGFGAAVIDAYHDYFAERLQRCFRGSAPALERLRVFTRAAEAGMARHGYTRGCLVGVLGQETGALPDGYAARLAEVLADWQARTTVLLEEAAREGALRPGADPQALASLFWTGWEGAVLRARMERGPDPLRHFAETFLALVARDETPQRQAGTDKED